jgi:UrcA family protein
MNAITPFVAAAMIFAPAAAAAAAAAATVETVETRVTVSWADLRLEREGDARRLLIRIDRAAAALCGGREIRLRLRRVMQACRDEAVADAVRRVDSPRLTALHGRDRRAVRYARR